MLLLSEWIMRLRICKSVNNANNCCWPTVAQQAFGLRSRQFRRSRLLPCRPLGRPIKMHSLDSVNSDLAGQFDVCVLVTDQQKLLRSAARGCWWLCYNRADPSQKRMFSFLASCERLREQSALCSYSVVRFCLDSFPPSGPAVSELLESIAYRQWTGLHRKLSAIVNGRSQLTGHVNNHWLLARLMATAYHA